MHALLAFLVLGCSLSSSAPRSTLSRSMSTVVQRG